MQEKTLYEYAVVRLVPRVEREEFINVGVALFCRKKRYANVLYHVDLEKAKVLFPDLNLDMVNAHLASFVHICKGDPSGGKLATLDQTERFRWLTANRSTLIQCSAVHPGLCIDPEETLKSLFDKLVL